MSKFDDARLGMKRSPPLHGVFEPSPEVGVFRPMPNRKLSTNLIFWLRKNSHEISENQRKNR